MIWFIIGIFVRAPIGYFTAALMFISRRRPNDNERRSD